VNALARPTDYKIEGADSVVGDVAVPDKASLGWSPAEHVVVQLGGQEMVKDFIAPITVPDEESSVIEFAAVDVPAGSLLADIDGFDPEALDLNELLSKTEIVPDLTPVISPDEADSAQPANPDAPQILDLSDVAQMPDGLAFPPLTVVIDDESGSDTVAV